MSKNYFVTFHYYLKTRSTIMNLEEIMRLYRILGDTHNIRVFDVNDEGMPIEMEVERKEWLTNSHHVDVTEHVSIFDKLRIEAPFCKYPTGGWFGFQYNISREPANAECVVSVKESQEMAMKNSANRERLNRNGMAILWQVA